MSGCMPPSVTNKHDPVVHAYMRKRRESIFTLRNITTFISISLSLFRTTTTTTTTHSLTAMIWWWDFIVYWDHAWEYCRHSCSSSRYKEERWVMNTRWIMSDDYTSLFCRFGDWTSWWWSSLRVSDINLLVQSSIIYVKIAWTKSIVVKQYIMILWLILLPRRLVNSHPIVETIH